MGPRVSRNPFSPWPALPMLGTAARPTLVPQGPSPSGACGHFLPLPPTLTTFSFPQTLTRRGPCHVLIPVPASAALLPPLGGRGKQYFRRWGLEEGDPGSSEGSLAACHGVSVPGGSPGRWHRVAGTLQGRGAGRLRTSCHLGAGFPSRLPHCRPSSSPVLGTLPSLCTILDAPPGSPRDPTTRSPIWNTVLPSAGLPGAPNWMVRVSSVVHLNRWPDPLVPACGLLRPCHDWPCRFQRDVET